MHGSPFIFSSHTKIYISFWIVVLVSGKNGSLPSTFQRSARMIVHESTAGTSIARVRSIGVVKNPT